VQDAISAVIGVGAPWYTSGFQLWNGTAPILNSKPVPTSAMPANSSVAFAVLLVAADAIAGSETEPAKPYSIATPNKKKAEEKAPSRKYFIAASCESSRRRRASPHSRYSGSDSTSSATNIVSRSFAAGNSSIPPIANSVSGKISVWKIPATRPSRSSALPGVAAACAANGLLLESPIRSMLAKASTRIVPWMNKVGRSTAIAPIAAMWPGLPSAKILCVPAITIVMMNAAASAPRARTRCTVRRNGRGTNASTRTPTTAAAKTISIGASWLYSMLGGLIVPLALPKEMTAAGAARTPITVRFPSRRRRLC
jgi:hypothetical protein